MPAETSRLPGKHPLLFHLVLLVVTCVLPVVGFSAVLMVRIYDQQWQSAGRRLAADAHALAAAVDHELDHARSALLTLGVSSALGKGDYARFRDEAAAVARRLGTRITLADASGNPLLATTQPYGAALPPLADAAAVRHAAESRTPYVTGLVEESSGPGLQYAIGVPIEQGGRVAYVLIMAFTPRDLADALGVQQVPSDWTAAVLDQDGRILWRNRDAERFVGARGTAGAFIRAKGPPKDIFVVPTNDDVPVYTAASRSALSGWSAVVGAPRAAIDAALGRSLAILIAIGALVLLVGLALSAALGRRLQHAVGDLIAAAAALGRGQAMPPPATPVRELAALGETLRDTGALIAQERARRDAAEASLRQSEAALAQAQRIAAVGSWEWDIATGTINWSAAMHHLFKLAPGTAVPSRARLVSLIHPRDRARAAAWLASLARGRAPAGIELRIQRPDGETRVVHCESEPAYDAAGALVRVAGTMQDVTERKRTEEDLAHAKAEAEAANRSKSDFLANMSHELRTPLNAVIGFSDIIENERIGALGNAKYAEYAGHIRTSGEHLLELITDILDFAKIDAGQLSLAEERVTVTAMIGACICMIEPQATAAGLRLVTGIAPDVGAVRGDERRLKQILLNLLSNAVKFTPQGGCITLRAAVESDGRLLIRVSDTGIGIAAEDIPRVLEPFGQVDNARNRRTDGTGLGLPLARHLVELHGGTFDLASTPGQGTTVSIHLPAERVLRQVA